MPAEGNTAQVELETNGRWFQMSAAAEVPSRTTRPAREPVVGVLGAIGDTPLVGLRRYLRRPDVEVWAKLEAANPGGSAKDRPATRMLEDALDDGLITAGTTIIESSSGNMGIGLAQACRYHGLDLICVADSRSHDTSLRTMRALGADVRVVSPADAADGNLLAARLRLVAQLLADTPNSFWPNQYANHSNAAAHAAGTMREIDEALDGALDYVFVATSTTGTLRGCGDYLRAHGRTTQVVAVDAAGSALFGGSPGPRLLPGFGAGVETQLSAGAGFDRLERVCDLDCVVGCRRLVAREAILAGASSGGVMAALDRVADELAPGTSCAVILADGGTGYLETVYDDSWVTRTLACQPDELAGLVAGDGILASTCSTT
jgi:2,3-diaminopropionate biosynthesis protein SbnA